MKARHVTLKQVSQAAGVSVQTASHILNTRFQHLYRPETRKKVTQVAELMGYRPNAAARSMLDRRSHIVGLLVPIFPHSSFVQLDVFEMMLGMNKRLSEAGYVMSLIPIKDLLSPDESSRAFREQMLDGVIVFREAPDELRRLVEQVSPVHIWCDTDVDRKHGCVRRDELHAGQLAAEQVIKAGYRRIIWVSYPEAAHYSLRDRLAGVEAAARRHGTPLERVCSWPPCSGPEFQAMMEGLRSDAAIIAANHHFAQAVANAAATSRLAPGKDFGLVSCDHSHERAVVWPELSRVVMDQAEVGDKTAEMLLQALSREGPPPASLVFRGQWYAGRTAPGPQRASQP